MAETDSKDTSAPQRTGPLTRLRVIDLGTMVAGPVAATMMADFGADVIKIEQPGVGDTIREIGPFYKDEGLWWQVEGRNKRSVTLDLRQAEGQRLLKKMIETADVVVENFRPGTLEKWGLGYADLAAVNPRIIMLSVSGFGQTGPNAQRAGYDRIGLAFSGIMAITGYPDRPPVRIGTSMADYTTAILGAFSVMMAVYHRDVCGGQGQQIDLALYESMFRCTDSMALAYDTLGKVRERTGNVHMAAAPGNNFETKDGRFLTMTISGDTLFRRLCLAMDRPDMADDPRYATHVLRWEHIGELNDRVATWMKTSEVEHVTGALTRHGIPYSIALNVVDIFEDPHYAARGNLQTVNHAVLGPIKMQGVVPRMSGTPAGPIRPAPDVGQDTAAVLAEVLNLGADEIDRLREQRVI